MDPLEQKRLLAQVRACFETEEHVDHYTKTADRGTTLLESDLLRHLPPPPAAVLDIGSGAGRIAHLLAARDYDVTGVDVSKPLTRFARDVAEASQLPARFLVVEPAALPFHASWFDVALAIKLLCYIPSREHRVRYLNEVARVLRPGARLLLTSAVVPSEAEGMAALAMDESHHHAAQLFSSLESLDTFIEGSGFVHWFTPDGLLAEITASELKLEAVYEDQDAFQLAACLRKPAP